MEKAQAKEILKNDTVGSTGLLTLSIAACSLLTPHHGAGVTVERIIEAFARSSQNPAFVENYRKKKLHNAAIFSYREPVKIEVNRTGSFGNHYISSYISKSMRIASPNEQNFDDIKIKNIIESGYATVEFISSELGISKEVLAGYLKNSTEYRLSIIKSSKGEDLYMVNRPLGKIIDLWRAFCFLNYLTFSR